MASILDNLNQPFTDLKKSFMQLEFMPAVNALTYFFIGIALTLIARWFVGKLTERKVSKHHSMLFKRLTFYIGLILSCILPLKTSGIDVTAILGAAGILTAAVAFAAQTSISNFLSGVFLVAEKPFVIGDYVRINDTLGEVLSIDLLSVKLRTRDNQFVRIPNENILKTQFFNTSRFPIRRFDIFFKANFDENLDNVQLILMETAAKNPLCLVSPPPLFSFVEFADTGVLLQFSVWGKQSTYSDMQSNIQVDIQTALAKAGIKLPSSYEVQRHSSSRGIS